MNLLASEMQHFPQLFHFGNSEGHFRYFAVFLQVCCSTCMSVLLVDHRILKYPELKSTYKDHQVQLCIGPPKSQTICLRASSKRFLTLAGSVLWPLIWGACSSADTICTACRSFDVSELGVSGILKVPHSQNVLCTSLSLLCPHR